MVHRTDIKIVHGDITETSAPIIVQQVNCEGKMGKGLAKAIADKYPKVLKRYQALCQAAHKDFSPEHLLGKVQIIDVSSKDNPKYVANVFGQLTYRKPGDSPERCYTSYEALDSAFVALKYAAAQFEQKGIKPTIAIPYYLGSGLGGGDFHRITTIIVSRLYGSYDILFYLKPGEEISDVPRYKYFKYSDMIRGELHD